MCFICGQPDTIRCNCEVTQPFCDQCTENNTRCTEKMDGQCVIYHLDTEISSKLINLNLPNKSNFETIVEKIDEMLGNIGGPNFAGQNSSSITWTPGGTQGHSPSAAVRISSDPGNIVEIRSTGVFAKESFKVMVDEGDTPDFLINKLVGGTDGIVSISVIIDPDDDSLIKINPVINIAELISNLCADEDFADCLLSHETPITVVDTNSVNLSASGINNHTLQADVKISANAGNIITVEADGLFAEGGGADARNGVHMDGDFVELGGPLLENTLIDGDGFNLRLDNNILLLGNLTNVAYTQPVGYNTGENLRFELFHKTPIKTTSSGTSRFYNAMVLEDTADIDQSVHQFVGTIVNTWFHFKDDMTAGASTQQAGFFSSVSLSTENAAAIVTPTMISAVRGSFYFDNPTAFGEVAGTPGTIDNVAVFKVDPPPFEGGMNAGTTPDVTNLYAFYIADLGTGSAISKFTNRFGIYQAGTTEVNRFFGPVQNAGGVTQFTSDSREKENVTSYNRGLAEIEKINTYNFNYRYNKEKVVTGIIAQELENIIPEAVSKGNFETPTGNKYDDFRMVDQNVLFYTMLNAIKELSSKVKALEQSK